MFPLIFLNLCAQVMSFVQHFTMNRLYSAQHARNNMQKPFCALLVFCVHSSHDPCARAHMRTA